MADGLPEKLADLELRVAELEAWRVTHSAGMTRRQQQLDAMKDREDRARWLGTLRGRRR